LDPPITVSALRQQFAARRLKSPARPELEASRIAALDVRFTASFLGYARALREGSLPTSVLDPDWVALRDTLDLNAALTHVFRSAHAARRVADLGRTDRAYKALRDALRVAVRVARATRPRAARCASGHDGEAGASRATGPRRESCRVLGRHASTQRSKKRGGTRSMGPTSPGSTR
jgi:hypothetical protein